MYYTDRHVPLLEHMHSHHFTYESIPVHVAIGLHGFYETIYTSHVITIISKTSRFYIGLAVGLPVFSNISIILTHVQTVLSLQGKATSRNWLNR